jgi:hypothetical protein
MGRTRHDNDDSDHTAMVLPSRPDDPVIIAAAAGKTMRESGGGRPHQTLPSRQHNRGPPLEDDPAAIAEDLLLGKEKIADYLKLLGFAKADPYYLKRSKTGWPIGNAGGERSQLVASKRRLRNHVEKIMRGPSAA